MEVETVRVDHNDERVVQGESVRIVLDGSGCGAEGCNCSPSSFVTLSDGDTLLTVSLDPDDVRRLQRTGYLDA